MKRGSGFVNSTWNQGARSYGGESLFLYADTVQPSYPDAYVAHGLGKPQSRGSVCCQSDARQTASVASDTEPHGVLSSRAGHEHLCRERSGLRVERGSRCAAGHRGQVEPERGPANRVASRAEARAQIRSSHRLARDPFAWVVRGRRNNRALPRTPEKSSICESIKAETFGHYTSGWTAFVPPLILRSFKYFKSTVSMKFDVVRFSPAASEESSCFMSSCTQSPIILLCGSRPITL